MVSAAWVASLLVVLLFGLWVVAPQWPDWMKALLCYVFCWFHRNFRRDREPPEWIIVPDSSPKSGKEVTLFKARGRHPVRVVRWVNDDPKDREEEGVMIADQVIIHLKPSVKRIPRLRWARKGLRILDVGLAGGEDEGEAAGRCVLVTRSFWSFFGRGRSLRDWVYTCCQESKRFGKEVRSIERNEIVFVASHIYSSYFEQWGLVRIRARNAWIEAYGSKLAASRSASAASVESLLEDYQSQDTEACVVAIPDSGIDNEHPELKGKILRGGRVFRSDVKCPCWKKDEPMDERVGHGTVCAGIVAAVHGNQGLTGAAWETKLLPVKFMGPEGAGTVYDAARAIEYSVRKLTEGGKCEGSGGGAAGVILVAWGLRKDNECLRKALCKAKDRNVVVVAAAGNLGVDLAEARFFPASYKRMEELENMIVVGGTREVHQEIGGIVCGNEEKAPGSNFGCEVDLGAPGVFVRSIRCGHSLLADGKKSSPRYLWYSGTSTAAALVAGVCALVLEKEPRLTAPEVVCRVKHGAILNAVKGDPWPGGRRLDAYGAVCPRCQ